MEECQGWFESQGEPAYRGDQLWGWLYRRPAATFGQMSNLSLNLRDRLQEEFDLWSLSLVSTESSPDNTVKLLWKTQDHQHLESVLIPMQRGEKARNPHHLTICVSTQIGCTRGCSFCLTGTQGFSRNLSVAEILDQVLFAKVWLEGRIEIPGCDVPQALREAPLSNVVFMGMGEPLDNYDAVVESCRRLTSQVGLSHRKVTISTVGIVPKIAKLAREPEVFSLALSLHAANDEVRWRIMPQKRHYPVKEIVEALRSFPLPPRKRFTVEYVMLRGINDTDAQARDLVRLLNPLRCKVNLIPYNPFPGSPYRPSTPERIEGFQGTLRQKGLSAFVRASRGREILAGCGQLRWRVEKG